MKNRGRKTNPGNRVAVSQKAAVNTQKNGLYIGVLVAAILVITIIVYSNSLNNGFVQWDDYTYVRDNDDIKQLNSQSILRYFTTYYIKMYQPVTMISYALDYKIGELNPLTYHRTNLIFHALNVLLVFCFVLLLTREVTIAAVSALFLGLHPLHVESVTWIAARKDLLYSFFYLSSLIAYVLYRKRNNSHTLYTLAILLFLLSLFSKSAAVTLPVILVLTDSYLSNKPALKNNLDKIPFFALSFLFGAISLLSQRVMGSNLDYVTGYSFLERSLIGAYAFTFYIGKSIFPLGLSAIHPMPLKPGGFLPIAYYFSSLTVILFFMILYRIYRSNIDETLKKDALYGALFFFFTIVLVLFIPVGQAVVAERYTYIPYIGISVILGRLYVYMRQSKRSFSPILQYGYAAAIGIMLICFAHGAYARNAVWKNTETLFSDVIEKYPETGIAYNDRGNARRDQNDFQGAMEDYDKAIDLEYDDAYSNRGVLRIRMNDFENAIEDFTKALQGISDREKAYYNRGIAKLNLEDYNGAVEDFSKAIEINPGYFDAYNNRGFLRSEKLSDFAGAVDDFNTAISLKPAEPDLYYNRGNAKMLAGNYQDAIIDYDRVLEIKPDYAEAYFNKGILLLKLGKVPPACQNWHKALELEITEAAKLIQAFCN